MLTLGTSGPKDMKVTFHEGLITIRIGENKMYLQKNWDGDLFFCLRKDNALKFTIDQEGRLISENNRIDLEGRLVSEKKAVSIGYNEKLISLMGWFSKEK